MSPRTNGARRVDATTTYFAYHETVARIVRTPQGVETEIYAPEYGGWKSDASIYRQLQMLGPDGSPVFEVLSVSGADRIIGEADWRLGNAGPHRDAAADRLRELEAQRRAARLPDRELTRQRRETAAAAASERAEEQRLRSDQARRDVARLGAHSGGADVLPHHPGPTCVHGVQKAICRYCRR